MEYQAVIKNYKDCNTWKNALNTVTYSLKIIICFSKWWVYSFLLSFQKVLHNKKKKNNRRKEEITWKDVAIFFKKRCIHGLGIF